jgi:hypothetical protein
MGQYFSAFKSLREAISNCPDNFWVGGENPRLFWRIVYHTLYYADMYFESKLEAFVPWEHHNPAVAALWNPPEEIEPYSQQQMLEYLKIITSGVSTRMAKLNWDDADCGFPWYKHLNRIDHQILSIRHIQHHVGQLSDRLQDAGIDVGWYGKEAK